MTGPTGAGDADARWVVSVRIGEDLVHDYDSAPFGEALALAIAVRRCWPHYGVHLARPRPLRPPDPARPAPRGQPGRPAQLVPRPRSQTPPRTDLLPVEASGEEQRP